MYVPLTLATNPRPYLPPLQSNPSTSKSVQALLETRQEPAELPRFHGDSDGVQVEINLGLEGVRIDEVERFDKVLVVGEADQLIREPTRNGHTTKLARPIKQMP